MKLKRLVLTPVIILFFFVSHAQLIMIDSETGEYKYEDVVSVEGKTQQQLQKSAKDWFELYYGECQVKSETSTISELDSLQSSSSFVALAKHEFFWKFISKNIKLELFYDFEIKTKDNRYKYILSNLRIGKIYMGSLDAIDLKTYIERFPEKYHLKIEEPIDAEMVKVAENLEYYMVNGKLKKDDNDW